MIEILWSLEMDKFDMLVQASYILQCPEFDRKANHYIFSVKMPSGVWAGLFRVRTEFEFREAYRFLRDYIPEGAVIDAKFLYDYRDYDCCWETEPVEI
jgi:hypothetical protein